MSILEKIDDQLTTHVLENIGKATVQAFGTASDLAKVGAEHTVRYVQLDATMSCCAPVAVLILAAIVLGVAARLTDWEKDFSAGQVTCAIAGTFTAVFLFISAASIVAWAPTAIEPAGSIIHEAIKNH
jgi:hypothetical protein